MTEVLEVFYLFAEWYNEEFIKTGNGKNLKELRQVFTYEFKPFTDKRFGTHTWKIAINGQEKEALDPIGNCSIASFHLHIYRNDWLVAICSPNEGSGVWGLDNQFIELLKHLLKKKRKEYLEAE